MRKPSRLSAPPLDFDVEKFCELLAEVAKPGIGPGLRDEGSFLVTSMPANAPTFAVRRSGAIANDVE
jgi:hypothetical protein